MASPFQESKALGRELQKKEQEYKTGINVEVPIGEDKVVLPPAEYFEPDDYDSYAQAKRYLTEKARTGDGGLGTEVQVTEQDVKYLLGQETKEELLNFDRWFYALLKPGSDPNKLKLARELYPDFFRRREREINRQVDICTKLAKMGLHGPKTEEQIKLLYLLDTGRITPPNLDLLFPAKARMANIAAENIRRGVSQGFFNPRKYTNSTQIRVRSLDQNTGPFILTPSKLGATAPLAGQRGPDTNARSLWNYTMGLNA